MTITELAAIAARHMTRMADAMIAACIARALATGEPLEVPERRREPRPAYVAHVDEDVDWARLMERNQAPRGRHGIRG